MSGWTVLDRRQHIVPEVSRKNEGELWSDRLWLLTTSVTLLLD